MKNIPFDSENELSVPTFIAEYEKKVENKKNK